MKSIMIFSILGMLCSAALPPFVGNAFGEAPKPDSTKDFANSLHPAAWAFEFGISSSFTLTSFHGAALALKRQLSRNSAVELGVGGYLNTQSNDGSNSYNLGDTLSYGYSQSNKSNNGNIQLNLRYLYYPNPASHVNFFLGGGPTFGYSRADQHLQSVPVIPQPPDANVTVNYPNSPNQTQTSWNAGVSAIAGVEYFVLKSLSIHARYGVNIIYLETKYNTDYTYQVFRNGTLTTSAASYASKAHGWQIQPSYVLFGLSVYFR